MACAPVLTLTFPLEQAKTFDVQQGDRRRSSVEGLRPRSPASGQRRLSVEGLDLDQQRRPSVQGMRARLISLGDDDDSSRIEVQIEKGEDPRFQHQEQQVELLEDELNEMDERFEKQEERLNLLQV